MFEHEHCIEKPVQAARVSKPDKLYKLTNYTYKPWFFTSAISIALAGNYFFIIW